MSKLSRRPNREEIKRQRREKKRAEKALRRDQKSQGLVNSSKASIPNRTCNYETVEQEQAIRIDATTEQLRIFGSPYKAMQVRKISYLRGIGTVIRYFQFSGEFVSPICIAGVLWLYFFINFSFSLLMRIRKLL